MWQRIRVFTGHLIQLAVIHTETGVTISVLTSTIGAAHGEVDLRTTTCCSSSFTCWLTVSCWCTGTRLGACLMDGGLPVSIWWFTTPVLPRSSGPDEKTSEYSSNSLTSVAVCSSVMSIVSKSNWSDTFGAFFLVTCDARWLHWASSRALPKNT